MQEILEHMRSLGYEIDSIIPDGKLHRFGKDAKKSSWFICHMNYARKSGEQFFVITFGNWSTGEKHVFSTKAEHLIAEDKKAIKKQILDAKKKNEIEREKVQEQSAIECQKKWELLQESGDSEYLVRKQITECKQLGVRFDAFSGDLYVPLRDEKGKLWSLQKITADGTKRFYPGARVSGCFHIVGGNIENARTVYIAEGLATAASVSIATGQPVVCAFSASGLGAAAKHFRERGVTICGDDDVRPDNTNPGRTAAEAAAKECNGHVLFPVFHTKHGTDWNDLHVFEGIEVVRSQLSNLPVVQEPIRMTLEDIVSYPYPDEDEARGTRRGTMANVAELIKRLKIQVRYNVISKEEEILIPGLACTVDNAGNATIAHLLDWAERCKIPTGNLNSYLTALADRNLYNPVAQWIESEPWDGLSRLKDFYETIQSPTALKETLMRAWLISAVAAAYSPQGVSAHGVLVLQGDQYVGKTKWFKSLAPADLGVLADGMILRPDDKDSVFQVISNWIVELGELDATFRRADISQLKAFITKDKDVIRRPYAQKESHYARRTVFFASVNDHTFLNDPTGNRRFWTIECSSIDYNHRVNMQQLWAEVLTLYRAGEPWYLTGNEVLLLNEHNDKFQAIDPIEDRLRSALAWGPNAPTRPLSATEVCQELGINNPSTGDCRSVGRALRKITGTAPRKSNGRLLFETPYRRT